MMSICITFVIHLYNKFDILFRNSVLLLALSKLKETPERTLERRENFLSQMVFLKPLDVTKAKIKLH